MRPQPDEIMAKVMPDKVISVPWFAYPQVQPPDFILPVLVVSGGAVYPAVWSFNRHVFVGVGGGGFPAPVELWARLPTYPEVIA